MLFFRFALRSNLLQFSHSLECPSPSHTSHWTWDYIDTDPSTCVTLNPNKFYVDRELEIASCNLESCTSLKKVSIDIINAVACVKLSIIGVQSYLG
jgi:hypothetical protein